ncbi:MAG: PQQ-binding-like beta-propeller repeat protein [Anaerolineae bacterium]|nr:PQQ-binding-like beta-propeller repeat protein [Anaerolineae bacterium]
MRDDGTGNLTTLTPDFRWNMLVEQKQPPQPLPGSTFTDTVVIQNTGVYSWPLNSGYTLSYWWVDSNNVGVTQPVVAAQVVDEVRPGNVTTLTLSITTPETEVYTLTYRLDGPPEPDQADWPQPHSDPGNTRAARRSGPLGPVEPLWQAAGPDSLYVTADESRVYYKKDNILQVYRLDNGQYWWGGLTGSSDNFHGALVGNRLVVPATWGLVSGYRLQDGVYWAYQYPSLSILTQPVGRDDHVYMVGRDGGFVLPPRDYLSLYHLYNLESGPSVGWGGLKPIGDAANWHTSLPQTPALDETYLYVAHQSRYAASGFAPGVTLSVFSRATGALAWKTDIIASAGSACEPLTPPVLGPEQVFVGLNCPGPKLAAVNLASQQVAWLIDTDPLLAQPALAYSADPPQLLASGSAYLRALSPENGQALWEWQPPAGQSMQTNPTVARVYIWLAAGVEGQWAWHIFSMRGKLLAKWPALPGSGLPNPYPALTDRALLFTTAPSGSGVSAASGSAGWALRTGPGTAGWFDQPVAAGSGGGVGPGGMFLPIIFKQG